MINLIFAPFCNKYVLIIFICAYNYMYIEDPQMIQLLLYVDIAVGNSAFSSFNW